MRTSISTLVIAALAATFAGCSDDSGGGISGGAQLGISVTPNPVSFPSLVAGDSMDQLVTIAHNGSSGTLNLRNVRLDANSEEISITQPGALDLQPGDTTTMTVTYAPTDGMYDSGTIYIDTNVPTAAGNALTVEVPVETTAQTSDLVANPDPLDFGDVGTGTTVTETIQFTAVGADEIRIDEMTLTDPESDFAVEEMPELPLTLGAGDTFEVTVSYTPIGGDNDTDFVEIMMLVDDAEEEKQVLLKGNEIGPELQVHPSPVDFGPRPVGQVHTLPLVVSNAGELPLEITDLKVAEGSSDTVSIQDAPSQPLVICPDSGDAPDCEEGDESLRCRCADGVDGLSSDPVTVTVGFDPTAEMEVTSQAIAEIQIGNNDSSTGGSALVPVYGKPEVPVLQVNPPDVVDFGFVAQNLTQSRTVNLFNSGNAPLEISEIVLEEDDTNTEVEYALVVDPDWGPLQESPTPGVLQPQEGRTVQITFENLGTDVGKELATLTILSNYAQEPEWTVDVVARRTGSPSCEINMVPSQLDFGTVPRGQTKTLTANIEVVGSGNCSFHSAFLNDCSGGFFGSSCPDPDKTAAQNGDSERYSLAGYSWGPPLATPENLKAGQSYKVEIMFSPPDSAPLFGDEFTDYAGYFGIRAFDPYSPSEEPVYFPPPTGQNGTFTANLHARSGIANLTVFPNEVDFGVTTIGCFSQTFSVNACNVGTAPLELTGAELDNCNIEFKVKDSPGLPATMEAGDCLTWDVVYEPQDEGGDACALNITSNDADSPSAVVPLEGSGTTETHQVDEWTQLSGQNVDVLFVVDNSGSMGEEQDNLANNFEDFISEAATWDNDYHIGVTTTDVDEEGGRFVGDPRIVDNTNWEAFKDNVKVGTSGSGTERGFMAAQQALSLPNTADSSTACTQDSDCTEPEGCYDGFCGGPNRGFLRSDASLELVFVSDEEEQSTADLNFYENFFKSIKGFFNDNLMHIHAIVGPSGGCSSSNGDASAGHRFIELANATGGNVASICDSNFSTALKSIGQIAFGLKQQFFLSRPADPPTLEVSVSGQPCEANSGGVNNWSYDQPSNSVIFAEDGGCMPQPEEKIVIEYDTICFQD
ncbi:MAG: choice-of-anchor D domain-containing protein [Myxococcota bacterium]